jgi:hypothetical protein
MSWGRVTAGTVALFAVVLAFLAGRVKSGADPTQAKAGRPAAATAPAYQPGEDQQVTPDPQDQVVPQQQEPAPLTTQQS